MARFDTPPFGLYKTHMKTLTITDAKKNLGRWLKAAAEGEDVAIVCGADIIALRKIEVQPVEEVTPYAVREYGVTEEEMKRLGKRLDKRYRALKRKGKLVTYTPQQLRAKVEEMSHS
jgi:antitoxin (DNA-binding transcriptional repressor) of toxin-antitoxin stability system